MNILSTKEFSDWYKKITFREKVQVDARIARIEEYKHLGDWKYISNGLAELRWKNGRRIYFVKLQSDTILLLTGGLKNEQKKDIKKAYKLLRRYAEFES
ncbi:MAG: type II toxin-antitoxin system RelE/ParE family toxin [Bdellovibrionales bacterium]|nr:type II toxin-antitoxin system RelE/ParE family toxin [Bdellovibrionales bacterium]